MKIGLPIIQENWGTGMNSKWLWGNKIYSFTLILKSNAHVYWVIIIFIVLTP